MMSLICQLTLHHHQGTASKDGQISKTMATTRCDSLLLVLPIWLISSCCLWYPLKVVRADHHGKLAQPTNALMALENSVMDKVACFDPVSEVTVHFPFELEASIRLVADRIHQRQCALKCFHCDSCIFRLEHEICLDFQCQLNFRSHRRPRLVVLMDLVRGGHRNWRESVLYHQRRHARDRLDPKYLTVTEDDAQRPTNLDSMDKKNKRFAF